MLPGDFPEIVAPEDEIATYAQIKNWVKDTYGWAVQHDCWIAHCKELAGLCPRRAWNRADGGRAVQCPPAKRDGIISAFRHFGMLDDE